MKGRMIQEPNLKKKNKKKNKNLKKKKKLQIIMTVELLAIRKHNFGAHNCWG